MTNNHFVGNADEVSVIFSDGQKYDVKGIGTDPNFGQDTFDCGAGFDTATKIPLWEHVESFPLSRKVS